MRSGRRNGLSSVRLSWLQAFAAQVERDAGALLALIAELNRQIGDLEAELTRHFETHPDADTQRRHLPLPARNRCHPRRPGLGESTLTVSSPTGFSDDVDRYTNAESRKNYAGTSPLTVASGKKRAVLARHIRNRRLYDAIDQWAFCALSQSPAARAFYDQHRATGDLHHQALRALANRLVGLLHGCLRHRTEYDEHTAWAYRTAQQPDAA